MDEYTVPVLYIPERKILLLGFHFNNSICISWNKVWSWTLNLYEFRSSKLLGNVHYLNNSMAQILISYMIVNLNVKSCDFSGIIHNCNNLPRLSLTVSRDFPRSKWGVLFQGHSHDFSSAECSGVGISCFHPIPWYGTTVESTMKTENSNYCKTDGCQIITGTHCWWSDNSSSLQRPVHPLYLRFNFDMLSGGRYPRRRLPPISAADTHMVRCADEPSSAYFHWYRMKIGITRPIAYNA